MKYSGSSSLALSAVIFASLWAACALPDYEPPPLTTGGTGAGGQGQGGAGGQGVGGMAQGGAGQGGAGPGGMGGQGGACEPTVNPGVDTCGPGQTAPCYFGQALTECQGVCQHGTVVCQNGKWSTKCDGSIVPMLEPCNAPEGDVNCDGHTGCDGAPLQGKAIGSELDEIAYSMAIGRPAAAGVEAPAFVAGWRGTQLPLVGYPTNGNVLFAKRGPAGAISDWSAKFAPPGAPTSFAYATGVSVLPTATEEVAVVGTHSGDLKISTADLNVLPNDMSLNGFVGLFKQNGDLVWAKTLGSVANGLDGIVEVRSVASDAEGNVYVAGTFAGHADFGNGDVAANDVSDGFVVSFTKSGEYRWNAILGGAGPQVVVGVAVSPKGRVFLAGEFPVAAALWKDGGAIQIPTSGGSDVVVAQLDPATGLAHWMSAIGGGGDAIVRGIAATDEKVAVTGGFRGEMNVGMTGYMGVDSMSEWDAYVALFDLNGKPLVSAAYGAMGQQLGTGIAFDPFGDVLVAGTYSSSFPNVNGSIPPTQPGDFANAFVLKISGLLVASWGAPIWARGYGDVLSQVATSVVATPTMGHVLVGGGFQGTLTGANGTLMSSGGYDAFVAELTN